MRSGDITMLKVNTSLINTLASNIAYEIQQELYSLENSITMPIRFDNRKQIFFWYWT